MARTNHSQIVVGRLLEIDVGAGLTTLDDVERLIADTDVWYTRVPEGTPVVIAADWRACKLFSPPVAERALKMLSASGTRVERSGILHSPLQSTSVLQVMRLVREANFPARRVFTEAAEMERWLGELLTAAESERLHLMLQNNSDDGSV
jgi:hypothetical protein